MQDAIDLLLVVAWTYANGYAFAWLIPQLDWHPHRVGSIFALLGLAFVIWGLDIRRRYGKFPRLASIIVWALPFNCVFVGLVWRVMVLLGLIN